MCQGLTLTKITNIASHKYNKSLLQKVEQKFGITYSKFLPYNT